MEWFCILTMCSYSMGSFLYMTSVSIHQRIGTQIFFHWTPTKYGNEQDFSICMYVRIMLACIIHQRSIATYPRVGSLPSWTWVREWKSFECMAGILGTTCWWQPNLWWKLLIKKNLLQFYKITVQCRKWIWLILNLRIIKNLCII